MQHQNSASYLSCHWKDTEMFLNAYKRAQVIAKKTSHTCLALSSFIPMKVKHYPIRTALLYALRTGHWTIGESFLRQHLLSHFSVNYKPLTSFQRHLLQACWRFRRCKTAKPSLRKLALQRSWWTTLRKAHSTWNGSNIHDTHGKRNKMARTMKFLPCINIWNELFLHRNSEEITKMSEFCFLLWTRRFDPRDT